MRQIGYLIGEKGKYFELRQEVQKNVRDHAFFLARGLLERQEEAGSRDVARLVEWLAD
jgi:hypothetical protein